MGMAASQARVLLLTSRKSDLELQAQFITQEKMLLSMNTEEIANDYTNAIGNKTLKMNWYYDDSKSEMQKVELSYNQLTSSNNNLLVPQYRIVNSNGDLIVRDEADPVLLNVLYVSMEASDVPTGMENYYDENSGLLQIAKIVDGRITKTGSYGTSDEGKRVIYAGSQLDNKDLFQNALRQGTIFMEALGYTTEKEESEDGNGQDKTKYVSTGVWSKMAWQGNSDFSDDYYTEDDALAEAQYQAKMQRLQSKDKLLDNELKQIETQQKAVSAEIESVQKVLSDNVDKSFKVFS